MLSAGAAAQRVASDPAHSAWVSANAGTGKTTVLVNRVLRLMLDGTPPRRILCITFTNAAAAEMRGRIAGTLSAWTTATDEHLQAAIRGLTETAATPRQLEHARTLFTAIIDHPGALRIQTIHSFCQALLGRFPLEAGVPPHFRIIDEQTARELLQEARGRLFSEAHAREDSALAAAMRTIASGIHEGGLVDCLNALIRERHRFAALLEDGPEKLVEKVYNHLDVRLGEDETAYQQSVCRDDSLDKPALLAAVDALARGTKTDQENGVAIRFWLEQNMTQRAAAFSEYCNRFLTKKFTLRSTVAGKNARVYFPAAEAILRNEQSRLMAAQERLRAIRTARLTEALIQVGEALTSMYRALKQANAFLDYEDLIAKSFALLKQEGIGPWIMYKMDEGIDHVVLDEAQDTSPRQWAIITALCGDFFAGESRSQVNRTFFAVGDEKQSIFGFQGADPGMFAAMKEDFAGRVASARKNWKSVTLEASYRSTEAILRVVDAVLADPALREAISGATHAIRHEAHRRDAYGRVELWPLIHVAGEKAETPWRLPTDQREITSSRHALATAIASTIRAWLDNGRTVQSKNRPVQAGDILILLQRRSTGFMDTLVKVLLRHRIPVAGIDRLALTEHIAVNDLMALAEFLLLPEDDLTLAAVLKTPLIGFSEDDLFALAYGRGKKSLWERLRKKQHAKPLFQKAFAYLAELLNRADFTPPFEFFSHVLEAKDGRRLFIRRLGHEVNDPLNEFLNHALLYEQSHVPSLQGFLHWLKSSKEIVVKRDLEQGRDHVRVMTVHGAKGLQAPIVFLPDTMQLPQTKHSVLWDTERTLLLWPGRKENYTAPCDALARQAESSQYREYLRLLYVALTRAEDELYICGHGSRKNVNRGSWYAILTRQLAMCAEAVPMMLPHADNCQADKTGLRIESGNSAEKPQPASISAPIAETPMPDYFFRPAPKDAAVPDVLIPSLAEEEEAPLFSLKDDRMALSKGKLAHALLEKLPAVPAGKRKAAGNALSAMLAPDLSKDVRYMLVHNVLDVLEASHIAPYFGPHSRAEVPITGRMGNRLISGQIDRLLVTEKEVWILDYKTSHRLPEEESAIPKAYLKQMAAYRALLKAMYPEKSVRCALFWTSHLRLTPIGEAALDRYAP